MQTPVHPRRGEWHSTHPQILDADSDQSPTPWKTRGFPLQPNWRRTGWEKHLEKNFQEILFTASHIWNCEGKEKAASTKFIASRFQVSPRFVPRDWISEKKKPESSVRYSKGYSKLDLKRFSIFFKSPQGLHETNHILRREALLTF